jgi:hypothetical protein
MASPSVQSVVGLLAICAVVFTTIRFVVTPDPTSAMLCVFGMLSVIITAPVRVPVAVGIKVTTIVQVPLGPRVVEAEQVVVGSSAKSPLALTAVMLRLLVLVLVSVAVCGALVVFSVWLPNVSAVPDKPTPIPTPLRITLRGLPAALSATVSVPTCVPTTVGVNVTLIVQLSPAPTELPQVFVCVKFPVVVMPVISSGAFPWLVSMTPCVLLVPTNWLPNDRLVGVSSTKGAVALPSPLRLTVTGLLGSLLAIVSVPVRVPAAVGVNVTPTAQFEAAPRGVEVEQVVVPASRAKSPVMVMPVMVKGALP